MPANIRPKAVCVVRHGNSILVGDGYDQVKGQTFFGPPGGGIEFGERAADAVRREMREELGVELEDLALRGVLENVFTLDGQAGHEIVFVFEARLTDASLYGRDEIALTEGDQTSVARWLPLSRFGPGGPPLYPTGLFELLAPTPDEC
jgi:ADP-ribose pyrophosphatase YjhB (NUDIX family)